MLLQIGIERATETQMPHWCLADTRACTKATALLNAQHQCLAAYLPPLKARRQSSTGWQPDFFPIFTRAERAQLPRLPAA